MERRKIATDVRKFEDETDCFTKVIEESSETQVLNS